MKTVTGHFQSLFCNYKLLFTILPHPKYLASHPLPSVSGKSVSLIMKAVSGQFQSFTWNYKLPFTTPKISCPTIYQPIMKATYGQFQNLFWNHKLPCTTPINSASPITQWQKCKTNFGKDISGKFQQLG